MGQYFGSGVIIATAFIHLLAPANQALSDDCLTGPITQYSWPEGIALMVVYVMFVVELMTMRYAKLGGGHAHAHAHTHDEEATVQARSKKVDSIKDSSSTPDPDSLEMTADGIRGSSHARGEDHYSHVRSHIDKDMPQGSQVGVEDSFDVEAYTKQLTAVFILEFGVVFHSIFIGLTLAVAGAEFITLYVVLVFHQTFEGLGLGTRLAGVSWPKSARWTPYILAIGYSISTPVAIAIGLGVRQSFAPGSATTLIVNGVFDSISAGILLYTGLIELLAHEFMFSEYMQKAPIKVVLAAIWWMVLGAALMALLGKWA